MNTDSAGRAEFDVRSGLGLNVDISSRRGTNLRDKPRNALPQARYERLKSPEVIERWAARGTRGNQP